jgi:thiamine biosynthesis protein ThiS
MIILNDKKVENPKTLLKLIKKYAIEKNGVCILVNGKIVEKAKWKNYRIKDGDRIEIVGFVGGG